MIDGFIDKFAKEMKVNAEDINIIATGKYASMIFEACTHKIEYQANLTLNGLYHIYKRNIDNQRG